MKVPDTTNRPSRPLIVGVAVFVILAWIGAGWVLPLLASNRGSWGDGFGGVNALFSGLALAALGITLVFQWQELQLQRKELSSTREELAGQRAALELQNDLIGQQAFEATFFRLLEVHVTERARFTAEASTAHPNLQAISTEALSRVADVFDRNRSLPLLHNWQTIRAEVIGGQLRSWLAEVRVDAYATRLSTLVLLLERSPQPSDHAEILRGALSAPEVVLLIAKALESPTTRLAQLVTRFKLAHRVSYKIGPRDQVSWLVELADIYGRQNIVDPVEMSGPQS